jgi:hypothetical protein
MDVAVTATDAADMATADGLVMVGALVVTADTAVTPVLVVTLAAAMLTQVEADTAATQVAERTSAVVVDTWAVEAAATWVAAVDTAAVADMAAAVTGKLQHSREYKGRASARPFSFVPNKASAGG